MPFPEFQKHDIKLQWDYTAPLNLSGYAVRDGSDPNNEVTYSNAIVYDLVKAGDAPAGLAETEPLKVRVTADGGIETERTFDVPWSQVYHAWVWFIGYATNFPSSGPPAPPGQPPKSGVLQRVIPAQDPIWPFLYCSSVELVEGGGAPIHDPLNFAYDGTGKPITQDDEEGIPQTLEIPAIFFAEKMGDQFFNGNARLRARFTSRPYRIYNDADSVAAVARFPGAQPENLRYVEWQIDPAIQNLPLPKIAGNLLVFTGGPSLEGVPGPPGPIVGPPGPGQQVTGTVVPEPGVLLMSTSQIRAKWHEVPDPPFNYINSLLGTVNADDVFLGPGVQLARPGTIALINYKKREWRNCVGRVVHDLDFFFCYRATGWNYYPYAFSTSGLDTFPATFGGDEDGPTVYKSKNYAPIWRVGPVIAWQ